MSTVSVPNIVDYTLTIEDGDKNTRTVTVSRAITGATTITQIGSEAQQVVDFVDALSTGKIIRVNVGVTGQVTGQDVGDGTQNGSDVERKGSFSFRLGNGSSTKIEVPAFSNDAVIDGANLIDLDNADVQAFVSFMTGGGPGGASVSGYGVAISELINARKIHRRNSRG